MTNRIYVACLASYNAGILHGKWIDVSSDYEEVMEEIQAMLKDSKEPYADEWAIHDSEGFDGLNVSESHSIKELCEYVETMEDTEHEVDLVAGVMQERGCSAQEAIDYIDDNYQGDYKNTEDWAYQFIEECGYLKDMPRELQYYFDYASYARDAEINDIFTVNSDKGVYVLWNN